MNHVTQLNSLLKLQKSYMDFMPFCPNNQVAKLATEIYKISEKMDKINNMKIHELRSDVFFYTEKLESKMNFLYN